VKRFCAADSAATSVKVGYRQASYKRKTPQKCGVFFRPQICTSRVFCAGRRFIVPGRSRKVHELLRIKFGVPVLGIINLEKEGDRRCFV
jgi:hypothetical protein